MRRDDWRALRGAVGVSALCVAGAVVVTGLSLWFRQTAAQEHDAILQRFRAASEHYLAIDEEERIIAEQYPRFQTLVQRGVIGTERRLDWVESLRRAEQALDLPSIEYRIEAQQVEPAAYPIDSEGFELRASAMELDLGLLHEQDLARLLDFLTRETSGLFSVERCELTRLKPDPAQTAPTTPRLHANCRLQWFTLALPEATSPP